MLSDGSAQWAAATVALHTLYGIVCFLTRKYIIPLKHATPTPSRVSV